MSRKNWQRLFSVLLLVGMLLSFSRPGGVAANAPEQAAALKNLEKAAQEKGSDKIEALLLERFQAEGNADFIVRYTDQSDLSTAYNMSWKERGEFV